jgi:hypothetical protein
MATKKRKKRHSSRAVERAAERRAAIKKHRGTGVWRPRSVRFIDRKKRANKRHCRGKTKPSNED